MATGQARSARDFFSQAAATGGGGGAIAALLLVALLAQAQAPPAPPPPPVFAAEALPPPVPGRVIRMAAPPELSPEIQGGPAVLPPGAPRLRPAAGPPTVTVRVRAPAQVGKGDPLTYRLLVENCSRAAAHHVTLRVTIPASAAAFLRSSRPPAAETPPVYLWKLGTLAPCARREIALTVQPAGAQEVSCCARVTFEHGQCVRTRVVAASGGRPRQARPGGGIPSPPPLDPPEQDPLPRLRPVPGLPQAPQSPLPPSRSPDSSVPRSLPDFPPPAKKEVDPGPSKTTPPPRGRPDSGPADQEETPPHPTRPGGTALTLRFTGPAEVIRFDHFTCKLEVRNAGSVPARDVVLRANLGEGLSFQKGKPAPTSEDPFVWNLGTLNAGAVRVVECEILADGRGRSLSRASVTATNAFRQEAAYTARLGEPGLSVYKTGPDSWGVGREATYLITVSNPGDVPTRNVELADKLPAEMTFVRATGGGQLRDGLVTWKLGTLAPGTSKTVQMTARARVPGTFQNVSTATADRGLTKRSQHDTRFDVIAGMFLELSKSRDPVEPDQELTFVLRLGNLGKADETNVDVVVKLPEGLKLVKVTDADGDRPIKDKDGKVTLPRVARLPAGKEVGLTIRLRVEKPGPQTVEAEALSDRTGADRPVKVSSTINFAAGEEDEGTRKKEKEG